MGLPKINKTNGKAAPRIGLPKIPPPFYSYPQYVTNQKKNKEKEKDYYLDQKAPSTILIFQF